MEGPEEKRLRQAQAPRTLSLEVKCMAFSASRWQLTVATCSPQVLA